MTRLGPVAIALHDVCSCDAACVARTLPRGLYTPYNNNPWPHRILQRLLLLGGSCRARLVEAFSSLASRCLPSQSGLCLVTLEVSFCRHLLFSPAAPSSASFHASPWSLATLFATGTALGTAFSMCSEQRTAPAHSSEETTSNPHDAFAIIPYRGTAPRLGPLPSCSMLHALPLPQPSPAQPTPPRGRTTPKACHRRQSPPPYAQTFRHDGTVKPSAGVFTGSFAPPVADNVHPNHLPRVL